MNENERINLLNRRLTACEILLIGLCEAIREDETLKKAVFGRMEAQIVELEISAIQAGPKRDAALIARDILYRGTVHSAP